MPRSPSPPPRPQRRSRSRSPAPPRPQRCSRSRSPPHRTRTQIRRRSSSGGQGRDHRSSRSDPLLKALNQKNLKGRQGQERSGPLQVYIRAGKLIPRVVDPWLSIEQVFVTALASEGHLQIEGWGQPHGTETEAQATERQVLEDRQKQAYKKIITLVPNMVGTITKLCRTRDRDDSEGLHDSMIFKFIEVLHDASNQARVADTCKMNKALCELMVKDIGGHLTPPVPNEKCTRGWEHVDTGRFNCPARLIKDYNEDLLARLKAGEIQAMAYDYPYFMYDPDLMADDDLRAGLCCGFLLIRAVEEILFGSGKPRITKHSTKDPIATKFCITTITPEIIAYGACQTRFSLSSVSEWPMQDMTFDLQDFYYNVLFLFEEQDDEWVRETLAYWQKYFFPPNGRSRGAKQRSTIPPPSSINDLVKLKNERARRRQMAQAQVEENAT